LGERVKQMYQAASVVDLEQFALSVSRLLSLQQRVWTFEGGWAWLASTAPLLVSLWKPVPVGDSMCESYRVSHLWNHRSRVG
jgi:hypothetical protein